MPDLTDDYEPMPAALPERVDPEGALAYLTAASVLAVVALVVAVIGAAV